MVPTPRPCPALTGKRGGKLDNGWLSAEGVVAAGLAAVIILVVVQHGHLVRSVGDQRVGTLGLAVLPHQQAGPGLSSDITDTPARSARPRPPASAQAVRPWGAQLPLHVGEGTGTHHHHTHTHPSAGAHLGAWALPEQKEVALLVAVAAQRLADHILIGVGVIPGLRKHVPVGGPTGNVLQPTQCPGGLAEVAPCPEGMTTIPTSLPKPLPLSPTD